MATDLYSVLGIKRSASTAEIKKAYRKLARENHPDVNPGDAASEETFKRVSAAFDVLGDEKKRKLYDEFDIDGLRDGFDPERARAYKQWTEHDLGGFSDLGSIFGDVFGGRRPRSRGPQRGRDAEANIVIDFITALRGGERRITIDRARLCETCGGTGRGVRGVCPTCRGNGAIPSPTHVNVKIPAGIDTGGRIRLAAQGDQGAGGGPPGDLYLNIRVTPHPDIRREGDDLYVKVPVSIGEVVAGAVIAVATPDGGSVKLTVPRRSQNGQKLRLKGKGAPNPKTKSRGNLVVVLDVKLPTSDDDAVEQLAQELEKYYADEAKRKL
jgi:molecular chaperone DnaJ